MGAQFTHSSFVLHEKFGGSSCGAMTLRGTASRVGVVRSMQAVSRQQLRRWLAGASWWHTLAASGDSDALRLSHDLRAGYGIYSPRSLPARARAVLLQTTIARAVVQ